MTLMKLPMGTRSGELIDLDDLHPGEVHLNDIGWALSMTCRFGGHSSRFYSVAEHSLLVHHLVAEQSADRDMLRAALLHDAHEAYVGDLPTPLKQRLGEPYYTMTRELDTVIGERFGLDPELFHTDCVKAADAAALAIEARYLGMQWATPAPFPPWHLGTKPPARWFREFVTAYERA